MVRNLTELELRTRTLAEQCEAACLLEAAARKFGNVHPDASFKDLCFEDFVTSAQTVGPVLGEVQRHGISQTLLDAVQATREKVGSNTNLGILMLLAPLASVISTPIAQAEVSEAIAALNVSDSERFFEAIRLAMPGGLQQVDEEDVSEKPRLPLREIMQLAEDRDLIARQYVNGFHDVLVVGRGWFLASIQLGLNWEQAILRCQLQFMATYSDSLVARKCGTEIADELQVRAAQLLREGDQSSFSSVECLRFDEWLRADGHRRNPGTTADMIAAVLFTVIRNGDWIPPLTIPVEKVSLFAVRSSRNGSFENEIKA